MAHANPLVDTVVNLNGSTDRGTDSAQQEQMEVEPVRAGQDGNVALAGGDNESGSIRNEAINVRGVDHLSTDDVKAFATAYYEVIPSIEWVDDTSCNLVYESSEAAIEALQSLSVSDQNTSAETLRMAKPLPGNPDASMKLRMAFRTDVKVKGARDRSKYYLFYGDPRETRERRHGSPRHSPRRRSTSQRGRRRSASPRSKDFDLFPDRVRNGGTPTASHDLLSGRRERRSGPSSPIESPLEPRIGEKPELFPDKVRKRTKAEDMFS